MIHSPSKYTSLARLKQIRQDNYIGEGGKEYCASEVDWLIFDKETRLAESMSEFSREEIVEQIERESNRRLVDFQKAFMNEMRQTFKIIQFGKVAM